MAIQKKKIVKVVASALLVMFVFNLIAKSYRMTQQPDPASFWQYLLLNTINSFKIGQASAYIDGNTGKIAWG